MSVEIVPDGCYKCAYCGEIVPYTGVHTCNFTFKFLTPTESFLQEIVILLREIKVLLENTQ